jgi:hypothetical protein
MMMVMVIIIIIIIEKITTATTVCTELIAHNILHTYMGGSLFESRTGHRAFSQVFPGLPQPLYANSEIYLD